MNLYRTVLAEGLRQDLAAFLNRDLLMSQWPVLRTLISRPIREVWEDAFPEPTATRAATAVNGRVNLTDLHRRLLADVLAIGTPYPPTATPATPPLSASWNAPTSSSRSRPTPVGLSTRESLDPARSERSCSP